MSASVPKFSSFKAKQATGDNEPREATQPERHASSKHKSHHHSQEGRHGRHHRSHHEPRSEDRDRRRGVQVSKDEARGDEVAFKPSIPLAHPSNDGLFIIDKRGDEKNIVYGRLHGYSVPNFRRYGSGCVLGCSQHMKIDRAYSDEKGIVLGDRHVGFLSASIWGNHNLAKREKRGERLLKVRSEDQGANVDFDADFIPLSSLGKKRKRAETDDGFLSEDENQHYRSIEGKAKDVLEQGLQYATDSSSSGLEDGRQLKMDSAIKTMSIELARKVENYPQDIEAWCELINHQDKLLGFGEDGPRKVTQAERQSTAEIKLHMYEKALRLMGSSSLSSIEMLHIGLMNESAKVWPMEKQTKRWQDMVQMQPLSIKLWRKYVDFKQSDVSSFSYEEHRALFSTRIEFLNSLVMEGRHSESKLDSLYNCIIYTLLRMTVFMREAGYQELAIAIWQGIIEYNIFSPAEKPKASSTATLEIFRDFWESEVPRIGESGAIGWERYFKDPSSLPAPNPRTDTAPPEISFDDDSVFKKWITAEISQSKESREPARTVDDVAENDPYRVILFDDIAPFLVLLPTHTQTNLFNAFLSFCQLPASGSNDFSKAWQDDPFLRTELLHQHKSALQKQFASTENVESCNVFAQYSFQNFVTSPDSLFAAGSKWFRSMQPWNATFGDDSAPVPYRFVRNALQALSGKSPHYAEYSLAFEFSNEPQNVKKFAKALLKRFPSSLALYNAYLLMQWNGGNKDVARNVFSSAVGLSSSLPDEERDNVFLLRKSLVWALLEDGNRKEAFQHLLGTEEVSPAAILKTRQDLSVARDHSLSRGQTSSAVTQTELLAILEYYTSTLGTRAQGDIESAYSIFTRFGSILSSRGLGGSSDNELLHQSASRLLYFHAGLGPYRPAFIRENLTHSLTLFPQNTILLAVFAWNESRLTMERKVRSIFLSTILTPGSVVSHVFAIRHEILHGNVHSQKAAFEKAVSGDSDTKCSPGIWRLYLLWCLQSKESKAKDVFYRGVGACPWAKTFMMLAFEEMDGRMDEGELKGVYELLLEKELRLHVELA